MTIYFTKPCVFMGSRFSRSHCKLFTSSYTFTGFHRWKRINHICLSPEGVSISACYHPTHISISMYATVKLCWTSSNGTKSTKHNVDSYHALIPMSCDVPVHNAMRCATTCLCHTTYVRNAIWKTQTTQFIMCRGQLS